MALLQDLRRRLPPVLGPALALLAILYFAYHAVHGTRGILAWRHLEQKVEETERELAAVRDRRETLEHRVGLLHPQTLDRDMLDEAVRRGLGLARPDEIVIFTGPDAYTDRRGDRSAPGAKPDGDEPAAPDTTGTPMPPAPEGNAP
jgi:cell division protein FtsB